ncbi:hypothetical protein F8388_026664 [Cannabis sativa]|uniref:PIK-related kinase FAT domain-containing protein n=1 Tax=Cannabis sativa TaxID=3483 RepID=A0A7J6H1H1_CANSA|nr:hypothetical protein F8388_026664 [Cannabis sativa]
MKKIVSNKSLSRPPEQLLVLHVHRHQHHLLAIHNLLRFMSYLSSSPLICENCGLVAPCPGKGEILLLSLTNKSVCNFNLSYRSLNTARFLWEILLLKVVEPLFATCGLSEYKEQNAMLRSYYVWQVLLAVRALVLPPTEDTDNWLKFASLCRQSVRISQARSTLVKLLQALGEPLRHWVAEGTTLGSWLIKDATLGSWLIDDATLGL